MHSEVDLGGVDPSQAEAVTKLEKRHLLKRQALRTRSCVLRIFSYS